MSHVEDAKAQIDALVLKFDDAALGTPTKLVAIAHLGRAARLFKGLHLVELVTIEDILAYFEQAVDIAVAEKHPDSPLPQIDWLDDAGNIIRSEGKLN